MSPSQARFCQCTLRTVAIRAERTLGSLRYSFGGDHPSQTALQTVSPNGLEPRQRKGGISTSAPTVLAYHVHSLPPILHIRCPDSALSIRAGRNLPDKEFRYLRTVIVTAAVYRGFDSDLRVTPKPPS